MQKMQLSIWAFAVYQWVNAGKIPSSMIEGVRRYSKKIIDEVIKKYQV